MSDVGMRDYFHRFAPGVDISQGLKRQLAWEPVRPISLRWLIAHGFWYDVQTGRPALAPAVFDLVTRTFDDNGIALNPVFGSQTRAPSQLADVSLCGGGHPWSQPCTTQTTWLDTSWICASAPGPLSGHANWGLATYEGRVYWHDHSYYLLDDDYSFALYRDDLAGMTAVDVQNKDYLHCEFNSDQTINHFHTWYWNTLHDAVDQDGGKGGTSHGPWPRTRAIFDEKQAIVMGLLGLDCAHACGSELHPVYALAIEVSHSADGSVEHDTWSIFVRNWGDEGFCSHDQEEIHPGQPFTFTFRFRKPGATAVTIVPAAASDPVGQDGTVFLARDVPGTSWSGPQLLPNEGALVTFTLPPPSERQRINGMLHLQWEVAVQGGAPSGADALRGASGNGTGTPFNDPALPEDTGDGEPERALGQLIENMTPAERDALVARVGDALPPDPGEGDTMRVQMQPSAPIRAVLPESAPSVVNVPDTVRHQRQLRVMDALRRVFGERIPLPPGGDA